MAHPMQAPAITLSQVSKHYDLHANPADRLRKLLLGRFYRSAPPFVALDNITLDIAQGDVIGLVGRNGAGKSTLLQLVSGTVTPSTGSCVVRGRVAALLELGAGFNPDFSGRENVLLNAAILGLSQEETLARFDEIVAFSGIGDFIDRPVKTYSSGMYVRLAFSVAIHVDPQILIIDEALSVGDGMFARKSFERIMQLKAAGTTILFCSHSMYQVEALCNKVVWLEKGKVMAAGDPASVVTAYTGFLRSQEAAEQNDTPFQPTQATEPTASVRDNTDTPCRILDVKAIAHDGEAVTEIEATTGVTDLTLRIRFECAPGLPAPSVAIGIHTEDRRIVCSSGTHNDNINLRLNPQGQGEVKLTYPTLPLLKGHYLVDVWLLDENAIQPYDTVEAAISLRVYQKGLEIGVVTLPHSWQVGENSR